MHFFRHFILPLFLFNSLSHPENPQQQVCHRHRNHGQGQPDFDVFFSADQTTVLFQQATGEHVCRCTHGQNVAATACADEGAEEQWPNTHTCKAWLTVDHWNHENRVGEESMNDENPTDIHTRKTSRMLGLLMPMPIMPCAKVSQQS